jgi:hypothetical protein
MCQVNRYCSGSSRVESFGRETTASSMRGSIGGTFVGQIPADLELELEQPLSQCVVGRSPHVICR